MLYMRLNKARTVELFIFLVPDATHSDLFLQFAVFLSQTVVFFGQVVGLSFHRCLVLFLQLQLVLQLRYLVLQGGNLKFQD